MAYSLDDLSTEVLDFLAERHLATLAIAVSADELHSTPVGFTWDHPARTARVITFSASKKVRLIEAAGQLPVTLTQVDGGRWLTLHGLATVSADPTVCSDAVARYAARYRPPKDRGDDRRVLQIRIDRMLGRA